MHNPLSDFVADVPIPAFLPVRQTFSSEYMSREEIQKSLRRQLQPMSDRLCPGMQVCLPCGSRGIANIVLILRTIVEFCRERGAEPFVIPAMGSHGGATAAGQMEVLAGLGITEEALGCPIRASMEVVQLGETEDGRPVYLDAYAAAADAIIVVNRIKPHTSFRGDYESGLMKMLCVGMGKQKGAASVHHLGYKYMHQSIPAFGRVILEKAPVLFGVAILENAYDETAEVHVVSDISSREPELLQRAFEKMPRLMMENCDVLVVEEIGKNISGGGMDPNITGRFATPYASGGIQAQVRCVLSLTEATHGNGYGMGAADVVSQRLYDQLDFQKTYPNAITSTALPFARLPLVMPSDRDAIALCIRAATDIGPKGPRIVFIRNTLQLDRILVSEAMADEVTAVGIPRPLPFDEDGCLEGGKVWENWFGKED